MLKYAEHFCQQGFLFFNFFSILSHHYGFTTYLEILHFLLSNVIPRVVSACRILHIATAWQILGWIIFKLASREVLGKIILFVLEFSRLREVGEIWAWIKLSTFWKMKIITSFSLLLHFAFLFVLFIVNACW